MRSRVGAALVAALLTACSVGQPDDEASGEEIYAQLCANCHGADLGGGIGPALGPGSNAAMEDDDYLEFTIVNGRAPMPSFPSLDEDQVARLIEYLREVQAG